MTVRSVTIMLTTGCNLRCRYCLLQPPRRRRISWPILRSALDALIKPGQPALDMLFTGGEPLLAFPLLRRAVSYLEATNPARPAFDWEIVTNGLRLNDEAADFLDARGFDINLSFDGVAEAQSLRGPGTFEKLDALLDRLKSGHPSLFTRLTVAMTLSPTTVPYLADSARYFGAKRVKNLTITPCVGPASASWEPDRIRELDGAFDRLTAIMRAHYDETGEVPLTLFRKTVPDAPEYRGAWTCGAASGNGVAIDVDGRGYGCVMAAASFQSHTAPVFRDAVAALALGPLDAPRFQEHVSSMPARARACGAYTHPEERVLELPALCRLRISGALLRVPARGRLGPGVDRPPPGPGFRLRVQPGRVGPPRPVPVPGNRVRGDPGLGDTIHLAAGIQVSGSG